MRVAYLMLNMVVFAGGHQFRGNQRKFKGGRKQHSVPNAHVRSEIKNLDEIRKKRQKKANEISYMKSKGTKGKKFSRNGKRGKSKK